MAHGLDILFAEVKKLSEQSEGRHQELVRNSISTDKLNAIDQRIQSLQVYKGYWKNRIAAWLQDYLNIWAKVSNHPFLTRTRIYADKIQVITTKSPRMGAFLFIFIAFQLLLAASYIMYKRRRANGPKKYL